MRRWEGKSLQAGGWGGGEEEVAPAWLEGNTFTPVIQSQLGERTKETRVKEGILDRCGAQEYRKRLKNTQGSESAS